MIRLWRQVAPIAMLVILGCAGNPQLGITPELLERKPVCLELDWSGGSRAEFYGRLAPDTLLLLPADGERHGFEENADAWGRISLAPSQADRAGGGWLWWLTGDTLQIRALTPTMEDLAIWAVNPEGSAPANWKTVGMAARGGQVALHPYRCRGSLTRSVGGVRP